jgi:NAD(P)-dependent dehydrogenase (short-subunit alcohol dehydrogenase family)
MGPKGITVNLVSPGLIRTPEVEAGYLERARKEGWGDTFDEAETKIAEKYFPNPLGRIATREEVAQVVTFLASGSASFINGQNLRVDGGAVDYV